MYQHSGGYLNYSHFMQFYLRMQDLAMGVNGHLKVRHLKRLKLSCLNDDTSKTGGSLLNAH